MKPSVVAMACVRIVLIAVLTAVSAATAGGPSGNLPADRHAARWSSSGSSFFLAADQRSVIDVTLSAGDREDPPTAFLRQYGYQFGLEDADRQLRRTGAGRDQLGFTHATYQQVHQGVPVFSGIVRIHQNIAGEIVAANGDFHPISGKLDTTPTVSTVAAAEVAREGAAPNSVAQSCELVIVDPGWYGDPPLGARLAYYIVLAENDTGRSEGCFVDAHRGEVLDRWSLDHQALDRAIYDGGGAAVLPGALVRAEGQGPVGNADADLVYDYAGDAYAYFWYAFGRNGLDDAGRTIVATVNTTAAPCPNAFWNFNLQQAGFCAAVTADDTVAHEITHGITQYTANLIYQNQSGQLNESFSDVFGELVDLFNGGAAFAGTIGLPPAWSSHPTGPGQDAPNNARSACSASMTYPDGVRWLFSEEVVPWNGAIRDMWDPTCLGDPDRANSPLQTCYALDNGGVHSGSGVPNHAFAMLCDGQTFNGYTVQAIGPIKAGAVWYRALTVYLTVAADFEDAYAAFNQAAADLIGTYPNDPRTGQPSSEMFTAADAAEVDQALLAVEMNTPGACGATVAIFDPAPPLECTGRETIFADDFESGVNGWTVFNSAPPTPYDWEQTTTPLPAGRPGAAWFGRDLNVGGCGTSNGLPESGVHSLVSPLIVLPPATHLPALSFVHYIETEPRYDGGQVLIRVNGGDWQLLPMPAFRHNPYNFALFTASQGDTNPRAGQPAFTGADGHWGTSLIDLGSYATGGDTVQLRFDLTKDQCYGITGWFIDDFVLYHCPASLDCNSNGAADELDIAPGVHRDKVVSQPPNHSSGNPSDLDNGGLGITAMADNFILLRPQSIESIRLWGGYYRYNLAPPDHFTVIFHSDAAGLPGPALATRTDVPSTRVSTGGTFLSANIPEWMFTLTLPEPVNLAAGTYWVEILNNTTGSTDTFIWQRALVGHILGAVGAYQAPGQTWILDSLINMSLELYGPLIGYDCNGNIVLDECDRWGDATGDGQVDAADGAVLADCLTGPAAPAGDTCRCLLDADGDGDLDLTDYGALQQNLWPPGP